MPSDFDALLAGANDAFATSPLAEPVTIQRGLDDPVAIQRAIVDHGPDFELAYQAEGYKISLWFRLADLAWEPAKGDIVAWNGRSYFVNKVEPDDISAVTLFCRLTTTR